MSNSSTSQHVFILALLTTNVKFSGDVSLCIVVSSIMGCGLVLRGGVWWLDVVYG